MAHSGCVFCKIATHELAADIVSEDADSIAFLDSHPLFPGHVLLCPRGHFETLADVPAADAGPMFLKTQLIARAVEAALGAEGTFIAINNRVSQTIPHLHIHIVPRRRRDGLRGFFWPRQNYKDESARQQVRDAIAREVERFSANHSA
ncbi:MAG: HIT family protein [Bryobacteraceae bacterium]